MLRFLIPPTALGDARTGRLGRRRKLAPAPRQPWPGNGPPCQRRPVSPLPPLGCNSDTTCCPPRRGRRTALGPTRSRVAMLLLQPDADCSSMMQIDAFSLQHVAVCCIRVAFLLQLAAAMSAPARCAATRPPCLTILTLELFESMFSASLPGGPGPVTLTMLYLGQCIYTSKSAIRDSKRIRDSDCGL